MTEEEWLESSNLGAILQFLRGKVTERRYRLCSCAIAALASHLLIEDGKQAIVIAEMYADQSIPHAMAKETQSRMKEYLGGEYRSTPHSAIIWALEPPSDGYPPDYAVLLAALNVEKVLGIHSIFQSAKLLRDIFGNPFRPVTFDPRWRTSDVVGLARAIYDDKAFERMPILADALMDAGCEDEQIIGHCRGEGPHVRGCWVVDLVLGKE